METNRDDEIEILEIEEDNIALIREFYLSKMRPREIRELFRQQQEQAQQPEELNAQPR